MSIRVDKYSINRAKMRFASRFNKNLSAANYTHDCNNISLLAILDMGDGHDSYRFLVNSVANINTDDVVVYDLNGRKLSATVNVLTPENISESVISVVLPSGITGMFLSLKSIGTVKVTLGDIDCLKHSRDMMMVNPKIDGAYDFWIEKHPVISQGAPEVGPLFSIITPVYNTDLRFLKELTDSVAAQTYPRFEHVLVNASPDNADVSEFLVNLHDERFRVVTLDSNAGIVGNTLAGVEASKGDYLAFLDHDDTVEPTILEEYARAINANPDVALLYCDEDTLSGDTNKRSAPMFKPAINYDLITSLNYVLHMLTVKREAFESCKTYTRDVEGSQDYMATLAAILYAQERDNVVHIPKVLYHWRQHCDSVNGGTLANKPYIIPTSTQSIATYLAACSIDASVHADVDNWNYRVDYDLTESLLDCAATINYDANDKDAASYINIVAHKSSCDYIILVDNTIKSASDKVRSRIVAALMQRPDLGVVAAKTITPEGLNLHVGLCVKSDGAIGYLNQGFYQGMGGGYNGCAEVQCDYSAADLSLAVFRRADFEAVGGFSTEYETWLATAVDFCFRMREAGKLVMVDGHAKVEALATPEMLTLGNSYLAPDSADFKLLWSKWADKFRDDVLDNPNYSLDKSYFNLKF